MTRKVHVGTSGWNYEHWKEKFYPDNILKKDWLKHYATVYDTVEVNYSFYHWPKKETLKKWADSTPKSFRFSLKAPRFITHRKQLHESEKQVNRLYELGKTLGKKMCCFLFQLPPTFSYNETNFQRLKEFLKVLDARKRNVIEFRSKGWWREEVYEALQSSKVAFCTVIGLGMPKDIVQTARFFYIRFHGKHYDTKYSMSDINHYVKAIRNNKESYVYFNNDEQAFAPKNAKQFKQAYEESKGID